VAPAAELLELHAAVAPTSLKLVKFLEPAALLTEALLHVIHQDGGHPHVFSAYAVPLEIWRMRRIYGCASNNKALHREAALVPVEVALELNDGQVCIRRARIGHVPPTCQMLAKKQKKIKM
jgi:hypothetical protein